MAQLEYGLGNLKNIEIIIIGCPYFKKMLSLMFKTVL